MARLLRDARGVASIEFAGAASMLLLLTMPVIDLGMDFYQQMEVSAAAQAGGDKAATLSPFTSCTDNQITTAASNATTLSVSPSSTATGTNYCTITVTASYTPILPCMSLCSHIPSPSASVVVRHQ